MGATQDRAAASKQVLDAIRERRPHPIGRAAKALGIETKEFVPIQDARACRILSIIPLLSAIPWYTKHIIREQTIERIDVNTGHELAMALRFAYLAMHRRSDVVLARFGVTTDQFVLLASLEDADALTQQDLARRLSSDASTVWAMLTLLEERGLVMRAAHPSDGRARCVSLTPKGRRALERMKEGSESIRTTLLEALGPQQVNTLKQLLAMVTSAMADFEKHSSLSVRHQPKKGALTCDS
jgi:DNA-binding MarR family transcriptional regulator